MPCAFHLDHHLRAGPGCQFPDEGLIEFPAGKTWCLFHLPMTAEGNETPKARWDETEVAAFNEAIFAFIDAAREEEQVVDLSGVVFPGKVSFGRYRGEANRLPAALFKAASFGGGANFQEASFGGHADFREASFGGAAVFSSSGAEGSSATAFHRIDFARARFSEAVRFHNRRFLSRTDFRGAHFERAPQFHGCTLHQDTFFPPEANFRDRRGAEAALAYRTLKHAMASVHARGEEAKFYVLEQKSLLRDPDTPLSTKLFSVLYWGASDYGQSVLRPLLGLLITFAVFCLVYAGFLSYHLQPMPWLVALTSHWEDVLRFALQQVFQPFQVFRMGPAAPAGLGPDVLPVVPLPLALLAALHSVLTLGFLTLFLLALRRRFKLV